MSGLLAHQGGWDEILLVLGPILVIAGLLTLAKQRVERSLRDQAPSDQSANDQSANDSDAGSGDPGRLSR